MHRNLILKHRGTLAALLAAALLVPVANAAGRELEPVPDEDVARITAAAPAQASVPPTAPRKVLVFYLCKGYFHGSIPWANKAITVG